MASKKQAGEAAAAKQRALQSEIASKDAKTTPKAGGEAKKTPVQAGARKEPTKLPKQHLDKPGNEHELDLAPRFLAPDYRGSDKLADMVAIVTGGDSGIGRAVAVLYAREGADVAIVYLSEHEDARRTKECVEREGGQCLLIPGDVKSVRFCEDAVEKVVDTFGRLDVLVNNAAFQQHV